MRDPRTKPLSRSIDAFFHLCTRTVNGEFLFGETEKEVLRRHIWLVADYCGLQVINATVMTNHLHITVRVPKEAPVTDAELLRRYSLLHPQNNERQRERVKEIERMLQENGEAAQAWRQRQLAMMGDISPYMQLLKQRFSIWFNRTHDRFGTLWADRYKSVALDPASDAVMRSAVYADLNPVRAALVVDPKDYRFCGYALALSGDGAARAGLGWLFPGKNWDEVQAAYRTILFVEGSLGRSKGAVISQAAAAAVAAQQGEIPMGELLRFKTRYFADSGVLGGKAFVAEHLAEFRRRTGRGKRMAVRETQGMGGLSTLKKLRLSPPP